MERITTNGIGRARRATVDGRDYFVAPLTTIVPGVLAGSQGALLYPPEEIKRTAAAWDGVPITVYHPPRSARDPGVLNKQGIGFLRNSRWSGRKLVHDGYFDVARTRTVDPRVYDALLNGRPMELSTGLYTDNFPDEGTAPDGRSYTHIARNYKPDHLAVLPTGVGACSLRDGCGLLVNRGNGFADDGADDDCEGETLCDCERCREEADTLLPNGPLVIANAGNDDGTDRDPDGPLLAPPLVDLIANQRAPELAWHRRGEEADGDLLLPRPASLWE